MCMYVFVYCFDFCALSRRLSFSLPPSYGRMTVSLFLPRFLTTPPFEPTNARTRSVYVCACTSARQRGIHG